MKQKQRTEKRKPTPSFPSKFHFLHSHLPSSSLQQPNQTKPNQFIALFIHTPKNPNNNNKNQQHPKAKKQKKKTERNNATAIVHGDIVGNGIDIGATIQDPIKEASDIGPGSRQAWSWANHGQDRWCHRLCGALVQRLQHDQDPEALDR